MLYATNLNNNDANSIAIHSRIITYKQCVYHTIQIFVKRIAMFVCSMHHKIILLGSERMENVHWKCGGDVSHHRDVASS